MAKLVDINHPALHQIAEEVPIEEITSPKVQKIIKDMKSVLHNCPRGVAIAAPQIGIPLRIFVVHDTTSKEANEEIRVPDMVAINPKITKASRKQIEMEEGCLSVPNAYGKTWRHEKVTIRAYDENCTEYERGASGLLAQIFQHETDHLDGTLYIDHAHETWETDEFYEKKDESHE